MKCGFCAEELFKLWQVQREVYSANCTHRDRSGRQPVETRQNQLSNTSLRCFSVINTSFPAINTTAPLSDYCRNDMTTRSVALSICFNWMTKISPELVSFIFICAPVVFYFIQGIVITNSSSCSLVSVVHLHPWIRFILAAICGIILK